MNAMNRNHHILHRISFSRIQWLLNLRSGSRSGVSSTVNIVDYSVSYPSGSSNIPYINLIYSLAPNDILGFPGTLTPYLFYADPNYAQSIVDAIDLTDLGTMVCNIANANGIQLTLMGTIGSNITVSGYSVTAMLNNLSTYFGYGLLIDGSFISDIVANFNAGISTASFNPTITLPANPPVSGTVYRNPYAYNIRLKIPVTYNPTSSAAATLATGISSSSTVTTSTKVSIPAGVTAGEILTYEIVLPAFWYYEIAVTNATIGTVESQAA